MIYDWRVASLVKIGLSLEGKYLDLFGTSSYPDFEIERFYCISVCMILYVIDFILTIP